MSMVCLPFSAVVDPRNSTVQFAGPTSFKKQCLKARLEDKTQMLKLHSSPATATDTKNKLEP
eukprot:2230249-Amphidinium_carterae.1